MNLTARNLEVLKLFAEGIPQKCIGPKLGITLKSVQSHLAQCRKVTGAESSVDLVHYALTWDLVVLKSFPNKHEDALWNLPEPNDDDFDD